MKHIKTYENIDDEEVNYQNLYGYNGKKTNKPYKFKVGDYVRLLVTDEYHFKVNDIYKIDEVSDGFYGYPYKIIPCQFTKIINDIYHDFYYVMERQLKLLEPWELDAITYNL